MPQDIETPKKHEYFREKHFLYDFLKSKDINREIDSMLKRLLEDRHRPIEELGALLKRYGPTRCESLIYKFKNVLEVDRQDGLVPANPFFRNAYRRSLIELNSPLIDQEQCYGGSQLPQAKVTQHNRRKLGEKAFYEECAQLILCLTDFTAEVIEPALNREPNPPHTHEDFIIAAMLMMKRNKNLGNTD